MLTALAAGWSGFALLLLVLMSQPLRMLAMRVVFKAYGVPQKELTAWVLKESKRNGMLDLARSFWNRQSQRRPNVDVASVKRFRAPRSARAVILSAAGGWPACRPGSPGHNLLARLTIPALLIISAISAGHGAHPGQRIKLVTDCLVWPSYNVDARSSPSAPPRRGSRLTRHTLVSSVVSSR